jgi:nicotinamide mononucleotide transporter
MKKMLNKFNWFEWAMIVAVIGFTIYFSIISEGVSLLYLIIDGIAAISGIFCVVLCAKGRKSQYIWGLLNVISYVVIAFI